MTTKTAKSYSEQYEDYKAQQRAKRARMVATIDFLAANDADSHNIVNLYSQLGDWWDDIDAFISLTGITQFVKDEENDQTYDIVAEGAALKLAIDDALSWINTNFPKCTDDGVSLKYATLDTVNRNVVYRTFASAGSAGLRTELQDIVDLIDP